MTSSPNLVNPPRIAIGTPYENPVYLNRNDAGGQRGVWNQEEIFSYWKVDLEKGVYDFKFKFLKPLDGSGEMFLELGQSILKKHNPLPNPDQLVWKGVSLPKGTFDLIPFYRKQRRSNFFLYGSKSKSGIIQHPLLSPYRFELMNLKCIKK